MWEQVWRGHRTQNIYLESRWQSMVVKHPKSAAKPPGFKSRLFHLWAILWLPFPYLCSRDKNCNCLIRVSGRLNELIIYVKGSDSYLVHSSSITRDHKKEISFGPKIFLSSFLPSVSTWIQTHSCYFWHLSPKAHLRVWTSKHEAVNVPPWLLSTKTIRDCPLIQLSHLILLSLLPLEMISWVSWCLRINNHKINAVAPVLSNPLSKYQKILEVAHVFPQQSTRNQKRVDAVLIFLTWTSHKQNNKNRFVF